MAGDAHQAFLCHLYLLLEPATVPHLRLWGLPL